MKVGWIGAGQMGAQMALRVARAGHAVTIHAREIQLRPELAAAGVRFAPSAAEAVGEAEVVCLCLFSDAQAREVMFGPDGAPSAALLAIRPSAVLAVHTSGSARLAQDLAARTVRNTASASAWISGSLLARGPATLSRDPGSGSSHSRIIEAASRASCSVRLTAR